MIFRNYKIVLFLLFFIFSIPQIVFCIGIEEEKESVNDYYYFPEDRIEQQETYYRAKIIDISEEKMEEIVQGYREKIKNIKVKLEDGRIIDIEDIVVDGMEQGREFNVGDAVVISSYNLAGEDVFYIYDYDRTSGLLIVFCFFLLIIFYFGKVRGLGSLLGLLFSVLVLIFFIVPAIIRGAPPEAVTLIGALVIASVSLFLAHGINKRTPIIWLSTVITLALAVFISIASIKVTHLFGMGSDIGLLFQVGEYSHINLRGLLLAGIVISVLGILNDVTATQTAVIWELKKTNPKLKFKELYNQSLNVGREHIASLVNTLALVYAGASLPLFILLKDVEYIPLWVKINSDFVAEELVRTIIGSSALILAVPISSILAAYYIGKMKTKEENQNKK